MKLNQRVHLPSQTVAGRHTGVVTGLTDTTFTVTFDSKYAHVPRNTGDELKYSFSPDQGDLIQGGTFTYPLYEAHHFELGKA